MHASEFTNVDDWLRDGVTCIGASESPAILGHGYEGQSAVSIWEHKVSGEIRNEERELFEWGHAIQPVTIEMFRRRTGVPVRDLGAFTRIRHRDLSWLACTLDAATFDDHEGFGVIEAKNVGQYSKRDWEADEPPLRVQIQIQHQMAVTNATHGYAVACVGGNKLAYRKIERNERFIEALTKTLADFWGYVERRELPPVDGSSGTRQALFRLWPEGDNSEVLLPPGSEVWAADLEYANEKIKKYEEMRELLKNKFAAAIGAASYGVTPAGDRFSYKEQTRKEHIVKESTFRVLRKLKG